MLKSSFQKNKFKFSVIIIVTGLFFLKNQNDLNQSTLLNTQYIILITKSGEVAEWSNAAVSKTVIGATLSRVRIPPSPQKYSHFLIHQNSIF